MRYLALVAILVGTTMLSAGQARKRANVQPACRMTADQSPEIRGLRLGMSVADLTAAFPEETNKKAIQRAVDDAKKPDAYGFARVTLLRSYPVVNPRFSGVLFILVQLVDEHISLLRVDYESGTEWKSADQFVSKLSDAFHLPAGENWRSADNAQPYQAKASAVDYGNRVLSCNDFTILATINNGNGGSAVEVKNPRMEQVVDDRREAAKEKVRQAFKP
jgi:hypothetical protein